MLVPLVIQNLQAAANAPSIIQQPVSVTVNSSTFVTFSVIASGGALSYQWYSAPNGSTSFTAIPGAASPNYTVLAMYPSTLLNQYYVVVSNGFGAVSSSIVLLNVLPLIPFNGAGPIYGKFRYTQA